MRKGLAFLSVGLPFVVLAVAAACGDDPAENTFPEGKSDASFESGSFDLDGSAVDPGPVVCNPALPTQFKPTWTPPVRTAGACTTAEIGEYYDACLPNFDKQPCLDWLAAHEDCGACIQKEDNSGAVQVFKEPAPIYRFNQGGCIALVQNKTGEDSCGAAFEAATECRRVSCDDCLAKGGVFGNNAAECVGKPEPTTYICCQQKSVGAGCKRYEDSQDQACGAGYNTNVDGGAPDCFRKSPESEKDLYVRGIGIFCGE